MSIAELIMQGGNRASESTAWVGDSLAKLGQNVGKALADREQQKQAQEMLPFLQQSMQESMTLAGQGKTGEAYAKMMPFLADPSVMNNPNLRQVIPAFEKGIAFAAESYARNIRAEAYRDSYSGGGRGGDSRTPQGPAAFFNQPSSNTEENYSGEGDGMGGAGNVDQTQANQPKALWADEVNAVDAEAAKGLPVMRGAAEEQQNPFEEEWSFTMAGYNPPSKDLQKKAIKGNEEFINSPAEQQQEFKNSVSSTANPRGTEFIEAPGLSNFKGFEDITGIYIPKETYIEFPESLSLQEDDKGSKWTTKFVKKTVNQQQMDMANKLAYTDLPTSIRRINDNQTLQKFFTENTIDKLDVGQKESDDGKFVGYIGIRGTNNYINLSPDDYIAVQTITGLPSTSKTLLSPLAKSERPTAEAPAPTQAGIPANQLTTPAPEIPEEAMALQKIVEQGQAAKASESAKNVEKRIKDIDTQIKQLSSAYIQGSRVGGGMLPGGYAAPISSGNRQKTAEEAQVDIQKITQLKAERQLLFAKTEKAYNAAKSEGRVFQNADEVKSSKKKFPAGTIIYIGREPAKVK